MDKFEGPVELIVIGFHGAHLRGDILPAVRKVVENGSVRIIDLIFIRKDADGAVALVELDALQDPFGEAIDPLVEVISGLIAEEDALLYADAMENDSAAAVVLFEHLWAAELSRAVRSAGGRLVADEVVAPQVVADLIAAYGKPAPAAE